MRRFVVTRTKDRHEVQTVHAFADEAAREAAVCVDVAREAEDIEAEVFLGDDLLDVVESHKGFFAERTA